MKVEISDGEILDKLSILEIKLSNITDEAKLANIQKEHDAIKQTIGEPAWHEHVFRKYGFYEQLKEINEELWGIEDAIRLKEKNQEFDAIFVQLARKVYQTNDKRAEIKKEINIHTGSELLEEKSYEDYS
jgi:predicted transposase YbfD/YdcC